VALLLTRRDEQVQTLTAALLRAALPKMTPEARDSLLQLVGVPITEVGADER